MKWRKFRCWLGVHNWKIVKPVFDGKQRICIECWKEEIKVRGGDWKNPPKC